MTSLIGCDSLVFQTLEDLKAACMEAADGKSQVEDFEVGVFCGKYKSSVPADYFERSSRLHGNKKRKITAVTDGEENAGAGLVASSGPMNVAVPQEESRDDGANGLEHHEDIRYIYSVPPNMLRLVLGD
jgi:amidophosphoribosyltransferase